MGATKSQLERRQLRLAAAIYEASQRLKNETSDLVCAVATSTSTLAEWDVDQLPPVRLRSVLVIKVFKSHRLESDTYAALKLVPGLRSLAIGAEAQGEVVHENPDGTLDELRGATPIVFVPISPEELMGLYDGNQIRSIISLINSAQ